MSLFSPDQYRMADHDPVVIGLSLAPTPIYQFTGFLDPLDNPPGVNQVKAGVTVPVRFSLGGDHGVDVFEDGYPLSRPVACPGGVTPHEVEVTASQATSSLVYVAQADHYVYLWKTDPTWVQTCRELVLVFRDGTQHTALFRFR